jgi:thioredoxin 1
MTKSTFININFINWEQYVNDGLILLDFWAPWCTACIAQDKIYNEIAQMFPSKLRIGKIDVSDNRVLADKFGVRNIPFLILINKGKQILQMPGIESKEYLISRIKKNII